jgi:hypothetical protein
MEEDGLWDKTTREERIVVIADQRADWNADEGLEASPFHDLLSLHFGTVLPAVQAWEHWLKHNVDGARNGESMLAVEHLVIPHNLVYSDVLRFPPSAGVSVESASNGLTVGECGVLACPCLVLYQAHVLGIIHQTFQQAQAYIGFCNANTPGKPRAANKQQVCPWVHGAGLTDAPAAHVTAVPFPATCK